MAEVLPAGDKIREYDSRVDPDAPKEVAEVITLFHFHTSLRCSSSN